MKKVDPPKVSKKDVDALTEDEAVRFFNALLACDFEFRCVLQVLITTGLRRGECLALQWADIKSVQEILGHADTSTTLNFYVKTGLKQMRHATEKYAQAFGL